MNTQTKPGGAVGAQLSGYTLAVENLESAVDWYTTHFGLQQVAEFALPPYDLQGRVLASENGWSIELLERAGATPRARVEHPLDAALLTGCTNVQLDVADLEGALERFATGGVEVLMPAHPGPGGLTAFIADADGNVIRLRTPGPPPSAPPA